MDRLTSWHRWTGFAVLWTLLAHVVLITTFGYAQSSGMAPEPARRSRRDRRGRAASAHRPGGPHGGRRRLRARRPAEDGVRDLALPPPVHVRGGRCWPSPTRSPSERPSPPRPWRRRTGTVWGVALGSVLAGRVVLPWRNLRHRLRVTAVVPGGRARRLRCTWTGRDLDRLPARAGQFFLWRFLRPATAGGRPTRSRCPWHPTAVS
ncbi:hypothetical protein LV779_10505 [Streptomyces thinghirensis]|nr:hypothetical protein [Streptomyces thinghirensis]